MKFAIRTSDLYLIKKETLATALLYIGMFIAFLGSLNPWFMWSIGNYYPVLFFGFLAGSYLVSRGMKENTIFTRKDFVLPMMTLILFTIYERISMESNINAYIMLLFRYSFFYALFKLDLERLPKLATFICKMMALLLIPSILGYIIYLNGFPLPCRDVQFGEFYSFSNYYLFMIPDSDIFIFFPRFISYFLEPSIIGSACAFLLFTQRGKWRKWYNIILLTTLLLSFSLASYIYLIVIMFFNSWTAGKKMFRKLMAVAAILITATIITFTYNGGDNLMHDLIMLRLEVDDGELAGDNRVTGNFESDYNNFIKSSDIILGRKFEATEFGNAGYRVFFYENGIVGIILLLVFYSTSMMYSPNIRAVISALIIASLYFGVSAFMLWENIYFSLFTAAYILQKKKHNDENSLYT